MQDGAVCVREGAVCVQEVAVVVRGNNLSKLHEQDCHVYRECNESRSSQCVSCNRDDAWVAARNARAVHRRLAMRVAHRRQQEGAGGLPTALPTALPTDGLQ